MQQKPINATQTQINVDTQTQNESKTKNKQENNVQIQQNQFIDQNVSQPTFQTNTKKETQEIIQQYESKIANMTQTINKLTKKNQEQKQQFITLNQKLNKAFAKLSPNKLKINPDLSSQSSQQLEKIKKQLENEMKRSKLLKKELQTIKQSQKILNDQEKFTQLKNQLVNKQRQLKQLKQKLKGYQRAQENQKKMTHFRKQEEMTKRLNQLNQENIFLKKKISELKIKIQESQKQKLIEKAEQNLQKSVTRQNIKKPNTQNMIKKEIHEEQMKKLQQQIKILQSFKISTQKIHKQQIQALKKQNLILHEEIDELKHEIKRKNKQKYLIEQRNQMNELRKSRLNHNQNSKTIDHNTSIMADQVENDDKNIRSRAISISRKKDFGVFQSLRKQFLGLSYGNFGNPFKKYDDTLKIQISKGNFTISSLKFIYFEEHIVALYVTYKFTNMDVLQIQTFSVQHSYTNTKTAQLKFQQHQYIKQLDIFCGKMVQFIQIKTSREQILQVGNEKSQFKSKKYSFDIRNNEKPVALGAITETKIINQVKKQCLISLGLITKKKDVLINKKRVLSSLKEPNISDENQMETQSGSSIKQIVSIEIPKMKTSSETENDKKLNKAK